MKKIEFIDLKAQYAAYKGEIDKAIEKVCAKAGFIMGEEVKILESKLSEFTGSPHSIACSNGTDALLLSLMVLDVKEGDEVLTTPFTFIATSEVISLLGAKPVFADIDEATYNIDPEKLEEKIGKKTKAIIPVSLYGQVADMDEINEIAAKYDIAVIEDGCQSFGAKYKGKKSCNLSKLACTSFFPSKPLGCYGDGGALFTTDEVLADKMRSLRVHGQTERYYHKYVGINGRLDTIQAAILNVKMGHFEEELKKRVEIGEYYSKNLALSDKIVLPVIKDDRTSVYAQYSIRVKGRDKFAKKLNAAGIPTAIHYPKPLHLQEAHFDLSYKEGDFPVSEAVSKEIVSIPMSPFLKREDQDYIIETILKSV
ncbi:MAG: DegT/DnrJ/EryC1/StrS family aminotransferase [bacterium]